jgi:rhamnopyranosyl-N-acetylglucosaminyl-diphospho-decaprenol beta-1,3/1,4-galactofuranosyltransferase
MGWVWVVVVTYNRRALLEECLGALSAQERAPDHVLVIDNVSTDGTAEMVRENFPSIEVRTLPENQGGAGGFHEGLKAAHAAGAEWMWLMDDDTIARPDSLARLLAARARVSQSALAPLLFASTVIWSGGLPHPMNAPGHRRGRFDRRVAAVQDGLMPLRYSTFVSPMVHRDAIDRYGLPLKHYFIWSDDIEFTARILRHESAGYLVPDSIVLHKTKEPYTAVSTTGDRF